MFYFGFTDLLLLNYLVVFDFLFYKPCEVFKLCKLFTCSLYGLHSLYALQVYFFELFFDIAPVFWLVEHIDFK
ncbi:MAG: hypothetical protein POELPBGB_03040 [Bacteroidia bacterium]|nr:hypothetical protein [Bacteroidia bacterium]